MNIAKDKIAQGRFFLRKAEEIGFSDPDSFRYYIEAAIVSARSVTHLLQKQYNHVKGFAEWYTTVQSGLSSDRLSRFFLEKRNFVLKEGIAEIRKVINLEVHDTIHIMESVKVKITGGTLQSRLRHLREDIVYRFKEKWAEFKKRVRPRRPSSSSTDSPRISEQYYFTDEEWSSTPATELLLGHFKKLETIVEEAIKRFGDPPSNTGDG